MLAQPLRSKSIFCPSSPLYHFAFPTFSWLTKHEGFEFELQPRDPSFLPKEFPNPGGTETCYFLESFRNPALDSELPLVEHINVSMKTISEGGDA